MNRVVRFVRSIIPIDPAQLFFLLGSVFLYVSPTLRFSPVSWSVFVPHFGPLIFSEGSNAEGRALIVWVRVVWFSSALLFISGSAGLFLCLWPGKRPLRNIILFVWLPAVWAIGVICVRCLILVHNPSLQMLPNSPSKAHTVPWIAAVLSELGPGFHFSVLGIVFISYFMVRMVTGRSCLPVTIRDTAEFPEEQAVQWRNIWIFVWFSITCAFLALIVARVPLAALYELMPDSKTSSVSNWLAWISGFAGGALLAGFAAWSAGKHRWVEMRRFLQLPSLGVAATALVIVILNWSSLRLLVYVHDRFVWAAREFGTFDAPRLAAYFLAPRFLLFLGYLPAALLEEIVYRGFLQPRFVRKYGVLRGLVILSLLWGASHFHGDFTSGFSDEQVLLAFLWRPSLCIALGLVLGWTRLRSGSILPAALIHGISNANAFSRFDQRPSNVVFFDIAFWALIAFVLFRYWPPKLEEEPLAATLPGVVEPGL